MSPIDMLKPIDTRLGAKPTSREDVVAMDATRRRDRELDARGYFSHRMGLTTIPSPRLIAFDSTTC